MELWRYLDIRPGITAVIGGGGKTTLLRTLGEELATRGRVLLCTTTKIYPFPGLPLADDLTALAALEGQSGPICAGTPLPGTGKLTAPKILSPCWRSGSIMCWWRRTALPAGR